MSDLTISRSEWTACARATRLDNTFALSISPILLESRRMFTRVLLICANSTIPLMIGVVGRSGSMWINCVGSTLRSGKDGGRRRSTLRVLSK
jgi:hypothetical protein